MSSTTSSALHVAYALPDAEHEYERVGSRSVLREGCGISQRERQQQWHAGADDPERSKDKSEHKEPFWSEYILPDIKSLIWGPELRGDATVERCDTGSAT
eukprot:scaffold165430_cov18-Prasinocladus_malaysianus.AAC.1